MELQERPASRYTDAPADMADQEMVKPEEHSATKVVESVIMDRFLRALLIDVKQFVCQDNPNSPQEMIEAVERFQASTDMLNTRPLNAAQP